MKASARGSEAAVLCDRLVVNAAILCLCLYRLQSASKGTVIHNGVRLSGMVFHISLKTSNKGKLIREVKRRHTVSDLHYVFPLERHKTPDIYAHLLS